MAWISVHEQVIGGKLRNLAKEIGCSQNEVDILPKMLQSLLSILLVSVLALLQVEY